ncbi:hypothetical protein BCR32DRAFT_264897 [Anaeromyces robustus]|uniref:G-protein coupled receptors family 1 profile domain-containing protein n=1 Tax=Anaeromyces robustus TaxID=1754192 RepID=A0A1Y1XLC0_9FUNG|nr:hypothetical protein BCR32DRAFT_264897 [Anaeromyces robustus]|eukprot:ORX86505.1 hypothetical protein BCR32DRAFT_264897 [Anaeromyces robustus]
MNDYLYKETRIDENICRWSINVYNCKDEDYFRSVYIIKLVLSICVSVLDSALIIYRLGIKRRNIITPYGIASIDGLLICTALYSYVSIYHSATIIKAVTISNFFLQESAFQFQFIFILIALQVYLTGTLNASPRYPGSTISFPRPRVTNIISIILFVIWFSIEVVGIIFVSKKRNFPYVSSEESIKNNYDDIYNQNKTFYKFWIIITYLTFCVACIVKFILFLLFGINLVKAANRSLEDMYRSKKIKSNVIIPIQIAILKMRWISFACNVIMALFAFIFGFLAFGENYLYYPSRSSNIFSKFFCVAMNLIPSACIFVTLLCIVYGEARSDIVTVFPSTHYDEEYPMNYTKQSLSSEEKI